MRRRWQQPAGAALAPVNFTITPGETAVSIANNLNAAGMLENPELFVTYAHFYGLDSQLEAGEFTLSPEWTIPELALTLTKAIARDAELRFIEGWRLEEMANSLAVYEPAQIDADEFLAIAKRERPFDLSPYPFLASLPEGASLEGFLFPDTYTVPLDADAAYLVDRMLTNFDEKVTPAMRQGVWGAGLERGGSGDVGLDCAERGGVGGGTAVNRRRLSQPVGTGHVAQCRSHCAVCRWLSTPQANPGGKCRSTSAISNLIRLTIPTFTQVCRLARLPLPVWVLCKRSPIRQPLILSSSSLIASQISWATIVLV